MKNRQTLSAVLLTALIASLAYVGISRGPVARVASPAGLALGQAPTSKPHRLAKPVAVVLPETAAANDPFPFRLKNTAAPIGELVRNETAVLLRNAFIDTALGSALTIPANLKTSGDPLTYIAQARGPATAAFRRHIAASGGKIISYIPNNAYLVRMNADGAARLANWHGTQSVLPFEPYYKLEMKLLEMALTGQSLPEGALLNVVLFPNSEPAAAKRLARLGVEVLAQDRTPFGPKLVARVPGDKLAALARLTEVQGLERHRPRRLANDLTRPRLGVEVFKAETDSDGNVTNVIQEDYLGLTGQNIYLNVNDSGVDDSHAAFGKRLKGSGVGKDTDGHGTFVAGIIAGDGAGSDTIKTNPPPGSFADPDFKGMAPKARLHVLKANDTNVNNHISDTWLQTESATYNYDRKSRVNVLISNNSWEYEDESDYTWAAASYDAATRDALPDRPGDQQVIYVFPAGNSGAGTDNGLNASPNTITAPGTAKNVITVGAIETGREIVAESYTSVTNTVTETDDDGNEVEKEEVTTTTNTPFAGMSDSDNQVAAFSSRGNVGIGIEGEFGRFKPDLVAPGTFIISTRSADWKNSITSTNAQAAADALEKQNDELGDQYRYESGTSVAVPAISGMLALMQEFYTGRLKRTNSPALLKALLINSAQSIDARYNHNVRSTVNHQGWGLPNLGRAVPALADDNPKDEAAWPMRFIDQSLTNALATGESRSWEITLGTNAMHYPLRFTLAWTDPPGNPNAAVKLVNDLDLIVTPLSEDSPPAPGDPGDEPADTTDTNQIYYGNNIGSSVYSTMGVTNDVINNVENVFIEEPSAAKYRITVYARRVNVDSLSAFYDAETPGDHVDVVQDFALVMSSANPEVGDAFKIKTDKPEAIELPAITTLTNGMPMLHQRVGANSPLAKTNDANHTVFANRSGITNQWHFYTFTNAPPETTNQSGTTPDADDNQPSFGKHVAFITFMTPNLSTPRFRDADIDLYVSRDANLTNLEPAVLDAAFRSTGRGGTEYVIFDDAKVGKDEVFYIGVKSEDQMAAEFGLVGLSTDNASGFMDDGSLLMMPMPAIIPDGSAANPGGVSMFGIYTGMPYDYVRKVTATSIIHHEEVGDLWGQLSHDRDGVVLNNHTLAELVTGKPYPTDFVFIYDDDLVNPMPTSIPTDGPGSLNDFKWQPAMGVWQFNMVDSALSFTGLVEHLNVTVDAIPNLSLIGNRGIQVHLDPAESEDFLIDVPFNATNMIVQLTEMTGPVDVYLRKDSEPDYNKSTTDADLAKGEWDGSPPRGELHYGLPGEDGKIGTEDDLSEGRWFVTVDNPGIVGVDFRIKVIFEYDISLDNTIKLVSDEPEPIEDDIVNTSLLTVTNDFLVGAVEVGVRIDHPRIADLDLHLVSPQGTRLLLSENRGHTNIAYGVTLTNEIEIAGLPVFEDGFELADNDFIDDTAKFHSGWELDSGEVYAYRSGEVHGWTAHSGNQFLEMNGLKEDPGTISTNVATEVDKTYRLRFAYAKNPNSEESLKMKVFIGTVTNLTVTASIAGEPEPIFAENFDSLELGPWESSSESGGDGTDWTADAPSGWVQATGDGHGPTAGGVAVKEFDGWTFVDPVSWENTAAGQGRAEFTKGTGVIAVGDNDEYDDLVDAKFNASLSTPAFSLDGVAAGTAILVYDSSWRQEPQSGTVSVSFDGGDSITLLTLTPDTPTAYNETVTLPLGNPEGANTAVITWDHQGHNNWWWAIDNIKVTANDTLAWELQDVVFDAKSTDTRIQFESLSDLDEAVMLDSVRLDEFTPANLYAVFSELENLARESMKFGDAPYAKEEEQVLFSGFEDAPIGLAKTNDVIDGWTVTNAKVRINKSSSDLRDDRLAHSGTYYATLSHDSASKAKEGGAIWRDLPTAVGQDYRLSFVTRASGDDAQYVLGGVVTNRVEGTVTLTNSIPKSSGWVTNKIRFTAARSSTPLTFRTESSTFRLDTIELIGPGPHNLAEEALDVLSGERAMGEWVLEVRDHRVGVESADTDVEPVLLSWYIKIMGSEAEDTEAIDSKDRTYTRDDTAEALEDGKKVRGRISENEINYWTVETCEDSTKLTIELSSGKKRNNAKVSLLASYGGFPSGDSTTDDYIQVDMNDSYFAELVLDDGGHLPLQPGELLYLTVQKSDTNVTQRAMYDILAKWDGNCGDDTPPDSSAGLIRLASAEGSESVRTEPGVILRYLWSIPAGTKSALLEVTGLTTDADIELLSTDGRHLRNSINLGQVPEQIVLREGDYIPSLGGDWVVQATNVDGGQNEFTLHTTLADEEGYLISSQPIELEIESQFWPPTVRLAWPSVPGERYVLESSDNLVDWAPVHEQTAGSSGLVFHAERSWFGERYYRVKQLTDGR
jgi:subtilisin-like proprotein convertase family protein